MKSSLQRFIHSGPDSLQAIIFIQWTTATLRKLAGDKEPLTMTTSDTGGFETTGVGCYLYMPYGSHLWDLASFIHNDVTFKSVVLSHQASLPT